MNIALATLVLILLLLPGAITLRSYYSSIREKQAARHIAFNELLFRGLFISFFLHWIAIVLLKSAGYQIDYRLLYFIIIGKELPIEYDNLAEKFISFGCYTLTLCLVCFLFTKLIKRFILWRKYDLDINSLVIKNYWYYIFSGDYLESKGVQGQESNTDIIVVDALADNDVIYSGYLIDFNYSPIKDELENIVIRGAKKQRLRIEKDHFETDKKIYAIPGDVMVIPFSKIKNFNIYYLSLELIENGTT